MRMPILAIGFALLLPACATAPEPGPRTQIDWEPPVWSSEVDQPPEPAVEQSEPDTSIPVWSMDTTREAPAEMPKTQTALAATEPTGEDAARDDPPHWVSLASLLEGRIERDLDATVRRRIDDAFKGVLDDDGAGVLKPWSGVGSNILGRLVLVRRYASVDGRRCGVVEHRHRIGGVDVGGSLTVCRDPSGDWMVEDLRWWSAAETQSRSLDDAPGGDTASGSWQTLSDALAAPEPGEAEPREGGWSGIPE